MTRPTGTKALRHHYPASMVAGAEPDDDGDAADAGAETPGPSDPVAREVARIAAAARRAGVMADEDDAAGDGVDEAVEEMERLRRRHARS